MKIESYSFGNIVIDGKKYTSDILIYPDHVQDKWWRKEGHELHLEDITSVLESTPEMLIIGTGRDGYLLVSTEVKKSIESLGIELKIAKTEEACKLYNKFSKVKRAIAAAFHLTC